MSLLDLIVKQKLIVVSIVAALMPMFLAVVYVLQRKVRQSFQQRAQRRAAEHKQAAQVEAYLADVDHISEQQAEAQPETYSIQAVAQVPAEAPAPPKAEQPATPEKPHSDQPSKQIQSLLTAVFVDDGSANHFESLLQGTQPIDMRELAQFSQDIAHQLHTVGDK